MTQEDKGDFENNNICRFCETNIESNKVGDHCHSTGKFRVPADSKCNFNVQQSQSSFISVILHNFSNYEYHLFFKTLVDKKNDEVELKIIPKTNEN